MRSAQITIKDIAKELGISASTVSRALKDHPDISEKTRIAVQELAKKLHYKPNAIALSLRQSKGNVIGIIVPQIVHQFFSSVISGIEEHAFKKGYNIIICQSNESEEREIQNTQILISSRVDGVVIAMTKETQNYEHFINIRENNIPMVFFDRVCPDLDTDRVIIDDREAAYKATEYLIKTGCKRIVHFAGPPNLDISKNRQQGYIDALIDNKLTHDKELIISTADTLKKGRIAVKDLLSKNITFDGIFTVNDMAAVGAMKELKKHGLKIPEQVSIFGFTNENISKISTPSLSTVEQHGFKMGYIASKLLLKRINSKEAFNAITKVVNGKLVIRKSTF
jgi:LacI family transcriptional regulator